MTTNVVKADQLLERMVSLPLELHYYVEREGAGSTRSEDFYC